MAPKLLNLQGLESYPMGTAALRRIFATSCAFLLLTCSLTAHAQTDDVPTSESRVCGQVYIVAEEKITFTAAEKQLLCGNDDLNAWKDIPANEASFFAKSFLQTRGYYQTQTRFEKDRVVIVANKKTIVRDVQLRGQPVELDVTRYWRIFGRPLTPSGLDDLDKWLRQELGREGIACPALKLTADPVHGIVYVDIANTGTLDFPEVDSEGISGVLGGLERRYDAFSVGERYDSLLLDLTSRRMINNGIVLNTYFISECKDENKSIKLVQKINSGQSRLLSFGFGIDTEEFLISRAQWKNSRLGATGTNVEALATASYRRQIANVTTNWYYAPIVTKHYMRAIGGFERLNEDDFDTRTTNVTAGPAWEVDIGNIGGTIWPHVSYDHVETIRSKGNPDPTVDLVWNNLQVTGQSHEYEYYKTDPREGYEFQLMAGFSRSDAGSNLSANRFRVSGSKLWNLFNYSPPIWIFGVRGMAASIVADEENTKLMPPNYRYFLGGSQTLRGFGRNALSSGDAGSMTVGYAGAELRLASIIPFGIQPIALVDYGRLGAEAMTFDPTVYWSPGAGVHWASPIGVFRATLAKGQIQGERAQDLAHLSQWMFYLSYGEQF